MNPLFDIHKTWEENLKEGPAFKAPYPERQWADEAEWVDFLGFKIASPIGIPAGPLLNSTWIAFAARMGYDVLTYKTIRSHAQDAHPLPNILPVAIHPSGYAEPLETMPTSVVDLSITNSFGNPSKGADYLMEDIARAKKSLKRGQILIVSVFGSGEKLAEDYAKAALLAKEAGADVIEANLSCPNVSEKGGSLYHCPLSTREVSQKITEAIKETPLVLKVGTFPSLKLMRDVFIAGAKGGARSIAGINTISMKVVPPLAKTRPTSGICGAAIREAALEFAACAKTIIDEEKLEMPLILCGGISKPEHFFHFLNEGAAVATSATAMLWNPYLGIETQERRCSLLKTCTR